MTRLLLISVTPVGTLRGEKGDTFSGKVLTLRLITRGCGIDWPGCDFESERWLMAEQQSMGCKGTGDTFLQTI